MAYAGSIHSRELVRTESGFPTKLYTFRGAMDVFPDRESIRQSLLRVLNENLELTSSERLYALGAAWGYVKENEPYRMLDVASYIFDKPWKECNPDVQWRFFRNGLRIDGTTCETSQIIFGEEGKLRRTTTDLEQYLAIWPDIGELINF